MPKSQPYYCFAPWGQKNYQRLQTKAGALVSFTIVICSGNPPSTVYAVMSNLQTYPTQPSSQVSQAERERIETVALLLDNLLQREEATARSILDCLYDVGSVRLIEQKVPLKALRWPLKGVARYSKPIFRLWALRWLKKHCPWMITDWLFSQAWAGGIVLSSADDNPIIEVSASPQILPVAVEPLIFRQAAEINALRGRVVVLTIMVLVLVTVAGLRWLA